MFRKLAPALVAPLLLVSACATEPTARRSTFAPAKRPSRALRSAPDAAAEAGTAAFEMMMEMSLEGETFEMVATGAYDADDQQMSMEMDLGAAVRASWPRGRRGRSRGLRRARWRWSSTATPSTCGSRCSSCSAATTAGSR